MFKFRFDSISGGVEIYNRHWCFARSELINFLPLMKSPNYYSYEELYPELQVLKDNLGVIQDEAKLMMEQPWIPWPEDHVGGGTSGEKRDWTVFPFLHTFPALDESKSKWIGSTSAMCPRTTELLRGIPNIKTALFSRLGSATRLAPHTGWSDLANYVLRCHICLHMDDTPLDNYEEMIDQDTSSKNTTTITSTMKVEVENAGEMNDKRGTCGMWVDGEVEYHSLGNIIVFDDSKRHKAFNYSTSERVVLIVDLLRPMGVRHGTAVGGHTEELNMLMENFQ